MKNMGLGVVFSLRGSITPFFFFPYHLSQKARSVYSWQLVSVTIPSGQTNCHLLFVLLVNIAWLQVVAYKYL